MFRSSGALIPSRRMSINIWLLRSLGVLTMGFFYILRLIFVRG